MVSESEVTRVSGRQIAEVTASGTYAADPEDHVILCDTSSGPITITLLSDGRKMPFGKKIIDAGGVSETDAITVETEGAEQIARLGAASGSLTLAKNFAAWTFEPMATDGDWTMALYPAAPPDASFVTTATESDLENESQHSGLSGADLHDPKAHNHSGDALSPDSVDVANYINIPEVTSDPANGNIWIRSDL